MQCDLTRFGTPLLALTMIWGAACKHQDSGNASEDPPMQSVVETLPYETAVSMTMVDPCDANVVFFDSGMTQLNPSAKERVTTLAQCVRTGKTKDILVVEQGGAEQPDEALALELARQRALSVAAALQEAGIDESMVTVRDGDPRREGKQLWPEDAMATRE